jgi:sulfite reductase (ferredoxin)
MQNLLIVNVRKENVEALRREVENIGLRVEASQFWRGAIACTGTEFCKLAITETKSFARWVVEELEGRVPGFDQQLKLNITGCPNSCGQHWIADLGLEGKKIKVNGQFADAYYFCVGGSVGRVQSVARPVGYRCLATEVPESITRLLSRYTELRASGETLQQFLARMSNDEIRGFLSGVGVAAEVAARDLPTAPPPHGVEG